MQRPLRLLYDNACILALGRNEKASSLRKSRFIVSRFIAALLSAWFSLQLLNYPTTSKAQETRSSEQEANEDTKSEEAILVSNSLNVIKFADVHETAPLLAGKTIDLTILAVSRALDTTAVNLWRWSKLCSQNRSPRSSFSQVMRCHADSLVFALSSGTVMWAWFYLPDRLPRAYNKWIGEAAQVDPRLVDLLREARAGRFVYGKDTGHAPNLQIMCREYSWPSEWGDPEKTIPLPCDVVHMGNGPSCHWNALVRFARAFKFAFATNLPLQLLIKARKPSIKALRRACEEAVRSSAFLGAFVGLFYYGVCLARTRLGPKVFSHKTITPIMWDSGLCVRAGCILCGWSILIEAEKRRPELAMFVAPRALATFLPREYNAKVSLLVACNLKGRD